MEAGKDQKKEQPVNPRAKANILSIIFFWYKIVYIV